MSRETETDLRKNGGAGRAAQVPKPDRADPVALDLIGCESCGRHFATLDGPGMIAAIKGPCPDCGSRFQLIDAAPDDLLL